MINQVFLFVFFKHVLLQLNENRSVQCLRLICWEFFVYLLKVILDSVLKKALLASVDIIDLTF